MAATNITNPKTRKLHTTLLIAMLVAFVAVYNRKSIAKEIYPEFLTRGKLSAEELKARNPLNIEMQRNAMKTVEDGALILSSGTDTRAKLFMGANRRDTTYSYAGIVLIENGYPFVYHVAVPSSKTNGGLRRDSLEFFVDPKSHTGFGIYRLPLTAAQKSALKTEIDSSYRKGIAFDGYFDLHSEEAMYNTEFVYQMVKRATKNDQYFSITDFGQYQYIPVDALFLRPKTERLFVAKYRN